MVRRSSKVPPGAAPAGARAGLDVGGVAGAELHGSGVVLDDEVRGFVRTLSVSLARGDLSLADDIEQETLLVALQRRPESPGALRAWLRSVARFSRRSVLGRGRRHGNQVYYDASIHDGAAASSADGAAARAARFDPVELGARREAGIAIDRALHRLPERYGRVIRMRVLEGMPPRAIAAEMDVPVNTVRTWTRRAFEQLREDADCVTMERADRSRYGALGAALLRFVRSRALWVGLVPAAVVAVLLLTQSTEVPRDPAGVSGTGAAAAVTEHVELELAQGRDTRRMVSAETVGAQEVPAVQDQGQVQVATGNVLVTVIDERGQPVAGAEIFVHAGLNGSVTRGGATGADGTAVVRADSGAAGRGSKDGPAWVAARGAAGWLSESVLLRQPYVSDSDSLTLRLREFAVQWIDVDRSARPDLTGPLRLEGIPEDPRMLAQESPLGGIRGVSCWVPAWEDQAGRFGVTTGDLRKYIVVWAGREPAAITGPVTIADGAPAFIALRPTWSVAGRLITAGGQPVAGAALRLGAGLRGVARIAAGYGSNPGAMTNGRGEFEISGLVGDSISLGARGLATRTIERPDAESVDVGVIAIERHVEEIGIAGRVHGALGPFTVQAVTSDWRRSGVSIHMLETRGPEDSVATDARGEFELQLGASGVRSILVTSHPRGDEIAPTWIERPEGGWGARELEIRVDPLSVARLTGELSGALMPDWVQFVHVASGHRLGGVFPGAGSSRPLTNSEPSSTPRGSGGVGRKSPNTRFTSPALCPGLWRIEGFDRRGLLCQLSEVDVEAGSELDLGVLAPSTGELDVQWPLDFESWQGAHLTVFKDGALWFQRRVSSLELRRDYGHLRLSAGTYGFELRGSGALWGGECEIQEGESCPLTMEPGRRVGRGGAR